MVLFSCRPIPSTVPCRKSWPSRSPIFWQRVDMCTTWYMGYGMVIYDFSGFLVRGVRGTLTRNWGMTMPFYGLRAPLPRPMELLTQPAPGLEHVRPWRVGMRWREPHWCGWNLGISKRHWTKLVGGLEHEFYFSIVYGIILNIFQRGWNTNQQKNVFFRWDQETAGLYSPRHLVHENWKSDWTSAEICWKFQISLGSPLRRNFHGWIFHETMPTATICLGSPSPARRGQVKVIAQIQGYLNSLNNLNSLVLKVSSLSWFFWILWAQNSDSLIPFGTDFPKKSEDSVDLLGQIGPIQWFIIIPTGPWLATLETAADGEFGFHGFVEQQHGTSDAEKFWNDLCSWFRAWLLW